VLIQRARAVRALIVPGSDSGLLASKNVRVFNQSPMSSTPITVTRRNASFGKVDPSMNKNNSIGWMDASDANAESSPADLVSLDSAAVFDESKLRNRPSRPKITPSQALFSISSALLFVRFPRGSLPALPTQSDRTHSIHLCL
jgi:hypothetical protein